MKPYSLLGAGALLFTSACDGSAEVSEPPALVWERLDSTSYTGLLGDYGLVSLTTFKDDETGKISKASILVGSDYNSSELYMFEGTDLETYFNLNSPQKVVLIEFDFDPDLEQARFIDMSDPQYNELETLFKEALGARGGALSRESYLGPFPPSSFDNTTSTGFPFSATSLEKAEQEARL